MSFPLKNLAGNHKSARPIVYKGVRYPSRRALAAALGISVVTLRRRLRARPPLLPKGNRHRWQGMVLTKGTRGTLRRVHKNKLAPPEGGQGYQP